MRTNSETKIYPAYFRLVESYRNTDGRVYHRAILNAGYPDELHADRLNLIQKIRTAIVTDHDQPLFELPFTDDTTVIHYVDKFNKRMPAEKRNDVFVETRKESIEKRERPANY